MDDKQEALDIPLTKQEPNEHEMAALVASAPIAPHALGKRAGGAYRPTPAKTFQCRGFGDCRMVFSRSEHLARHIRKHTGERPFACHCSKQFSRLDNLRQHAQTVHADKAEENEAMMRDLTSLHATMVASHKSGRRRAAPSTKARPGTATGTEGVASQPSLHSPTSPTFEDSSRNNRHSFAAPSPTSTLGPHSVPSIASRSAQNKSFLGSESPSETVHDQSFRSSPHLEPSARPESIPEPFRAGENNHTFHPIQQPFRKPPATSFRPSTSSGVESRVGSTFRFGPTATTFGQAASSTSIHRHEYYPSPQQEDDSSTSVFRFEVPDPGSRPQTSAGLPPLSSVVSRSALTSRPPTSSGQGDYSMDVSNSRPSTSSGGLSTLARAAEQRLLPLPTSRPGTAGASAAASSSPFDNDGGGSFPFGRGSGFSHRPGEWGMASRASDGSGYGTGSGYGRRDVRVGRPASASVSFLLDGDNTGGDDVDMDSPFSFNVQGNPRKRPYDNSDSSPFGFNLDNSDERPRSRRRSSGPIPTSTASPDSNARPTTSSGFNFSYLSLGASSPGEGPVSSRISPPAATTTIRSERDERRNGSSPLSVSAGMVVSGWKPVSSPSPSRDVSPSATTSSTTGTLLTSPYVRMDAERVLRGPAVSGWSGD